jgi:hypothetical protein
LHEAHGCSAISRIAKYGAPQHIEGVDAILTVPPPSVPISRRRVDAFSSSLGFYPPANDDFSSLVISPLLFTRLHFRVEPFFMPRRMIDVCVNTLHFYLCMAGFRGLRLYAGLPGRI